VTEFPYAFIVILNLYKLFFPLTARFGGYAYETKEDVMQHWFYLSSAIALEVAGTTSMKLSEGFTKLVPSVLLFVFYTASFLALTFALKKIEVSVAYAVWAGAGTALVAAIGIFYFREAATALKLLSILLIIVGVVGLHLSGVKH
jgi:small multidrug resistance pump